MAKILAPIATELAIVSAIEMQRQCERADGRGLAAVHPIETDFTDWTGRRYSCSWWFLFCCIPAGFSDCSILIDHHPLRTCYSTSLSLFRQYTAEITPHFLAHWVQLCGAATNRYGTQPGCSASPPISWCCCGHSRCRHGWCECGSAARALRNRTINRTRRRPSVRRSVPAPVQIAQTVGPLLALLFTSA